MERMPLNVGDTFISATDPEVRLTIDRLQWLIDGERIIGTRHPDGGQVIDMSEEQWAFTVREFALTKAASQPVAP